MQTGGHLQALSSRVLHLVLVYFYSYLFIWQGLSLNITMFILVSYDACGSFVDTAHPSPWGQDYRYAK